LKTPITVRVDETLLEAVRKCAEQENRSLTNYIETALKDRIGQYLASQMPGKGAQQPKGRD
jgi:hypothetical protein